jgi:hypothetical protein
MVELKSIEQLLYFMKGHIHLSRYDEKFIDNITTLTTVTTNQVVLFHRLVLKYRRQFTKHELFVEKLIDLPWNVKVVESSAQYTDGHITITEDMIHFKCPFNRNFIDEFRKIPLNSFVWNKQNRQYESPYSIYSFKNLLTVAKNFFPVIHNCETAQRMLDEISTYENVRYWNPTLVKRNDNLYILATNQALEEALGDIILTEDIETFIKLSTHGVTIGTEFYENNPKLKFMAEAVTTVEISDMDNLILWLEEMNCDMVYLSGSSSSINLSKIKLSSCLQESNMPHVDSRNSTVDSKKYKCPVLIKFKKNAEVIYDPTKVVKIIYLVNSNPIDIK